MALTKTQAIPALALGTGVAALCDGIAMPWASWIYSDVSILHFHGAAWIQWFVGVGMITAFLDTFFFK